MSERHFLTSLLSATILVGSFGYPSKHRKNRELQTSDQHGEVMTHQGLQLKSYWKANRCPSTALTYFVLKWR